MGIQIPYGIQAYGRADLPSVRLSNNYVENAVSVPGDVVLLPRPALAPRTTLGAGPIKGLFQQPGALAGKTFALSGSTLYADATAIGAVVSTGKVQMTAADTSLLIATGGTFYRTDGATVSTIAFPDDAGVSSTVFLGGYAFAARAGSRRFYFTLDTTTWDGLDYLSAEQSTDPIVGLCVVVDQLWVFCERHTEIFFLTGDADAPVQRVQGRVFDKGARCRDSIVKLDNTVFWLGNDSILYRADNAPQRVSDHGVEERIAASVTSDIVAWQYPWRGHLFYVVQLTGETLVYDVATKQWHQASSYDRVRWRAHLGILIGNDIVAGDDETGALWTLQDGIYNDGEAPIVRDFTVLINTAGFLDTFTLDCSTGDLPTSSSAEGLLELRTSRDGGKTWTAWRRSTLGRQGQHRKRAVFRRLGLIDQGDMTLHVRVTDPVPSRVSYVRANDPLGGRSR